MQMNRKTAPGAKVLNLLLLASFIVTVLAPVTGLVIHKLASTLFLLLSVVHTLLYRKRLKARSFILLALVAAAFLSGLFGLILDHIPMILALHKVISIGGVFALAIHIFIFHRRMA